MEYRAERFLMNFVCDLYVQKMNGYKPPGVARITIQPDYHKIWNRTWKNGSIVAIAPYFSFEEYQTFDRNGKHKYILDLVQTATTQLSDEYHWDKSVFERAYQDVIDSNFAFKLMYPQKLSRDKKTKARVIIEKTEYRTTLSLLFSLPDNSEKLVKLFEKANWFWYDITYQMARNSRWLDKSTFGVSAKHKDKSGYYSLAEDVIIGNLDFRDSEWPEIRSD